MNKTMTKISESIIIAYNFTKRNILFLYDLIKHSLKTFFSIVTRKNVRHAKKRIKQDRARDFLYFNEYDPSHLKTFLVASRETSDLKSEFKEEVKVIDEQLKQLKQEDVELYNKYLEVLKQEQEVLKELDEKRFELALELEKTMVEITTESEKAIRKEYLKKDYDSAFVYGLAMDKNQKIEAEIEAYNIRSKQLFDQYKEQLTLMAVPTTKRHFIKNADRVMPKIKKRLNYKQRKVVMGIIFILPWFIGFVMFFAYPFLQSFYYSFFKMDLSQGSIDLTYVGFGNYIYAFNEHTVGSTSFKIELLETLQNALINLPVLLIFSLFIAVLLNQEFRGRAIVRAIFFVPVILNSDVVMRLMGRGNLITGLLMSDTDMPPIFDLNLYLMNIGIGTGLVGLVVSLIGRIYDILTLAGIPILLFLAAIQSVPKHLYEAATIEGATGYEMFWLITLPNVSVHIVTVTIYAIVDTFLTSSVSDIILSTFRSEKGLSSAMAYTYVASILLLLLILAIFAKIFKFGESHYEK